jgi:uncharacterized LabA/DUF88 family protein
VAPTDRLRIALFIDFDNIEIGVKTTLNASFEVGLVLDALKERGDVVSKLAYSDWQRAAGYSRALTQQAIRMVQRNMTPGGDKNGADINLALDALEMAFTHPHINAFAIAAGDSDFISLVEKLKQYDKKVFVVGGRQFTSGVLQRNCHEFIAYENLMSSAATGSAPRRPQARGERSERPGERLPIDQAVPLVTRALKVLSERDLTPHLGLLKTTLLQLDSTFSERNYGAGSFRDFAQKLEGRGVIRLTQVKGGWLVGPSDGTLPVSDAAMEDAEPQQPASRPLSGTPADGVRELRNMLSTAQVRRWPLYLRNVKQLIREVCPSFDERAYGFGNLADLLRAAHRDGVVRVDRDRQGVIRVFEGANLAPAPVSAPATDVPETIPEVQGDRLEMQESLEIDESPDALPAGESSAPSEGDVEARPTMPEGDFVEEPGDNVGNVASGPEQKPKRRRSAPAARSRAPRRRRNTT